jgi:hypothetical protein
MAEETPALEPNPQACRFGLVLLAHAPRSPARGGLNSVCRSKGGQSGILPVKIGVHPSGLRTRFEARDVWLPIS